MPEAPKTRKCPRCAGTKKYNARPCAMCNGSGALARRPVFATATHLAERAVTVNGRTIQRCCICGFKLFDDHGLPGPIDGRGKPVPLLTWAPGDMVRIPIEGPQTRDTNGKPQLAGHWNTDALPCDFCVDMVE